MKLFGNTTECCGCAACSNICPKNAIKMVHNEEGFYYPKIEETMCVNCGLCQTVCPLKHEVNNSSQNSYYGFKLNDMNKRINSSSGGAFQALANYVLDHNGIIFGAGYTSNMRVAHMAVSNKEDLYNIQRTKYVQSDMNDIHIQVKTSLLRGSLVMFVGTPCQVHSLKLFLNKEYENLILVDIICYGVPSPEIWEKYVNYLESKYKGEMTDFNFRDKREHDSGHTVSYVINGKEYAINLYKDMYCSIYFKKYMIRPSCHECHYTTPDRISDFTIGDFWGVEKINPEFDDKMGTSLIIAHNDKAREIFKEISKNELCFETQKENVLQPRLVEPTPASEKRKSFMEKYQKWPFKLFINYFSRF